MSQEDKQESQVKKDMKVHPEVHQDVMKSPPRLSISDEVTFELTIDENQVVTTGFWNPCAGSMRYCYFRHVFCSHKDV